MKLTDVRVIGGGPAGMFAATLLRSDFPDAHVTVYERSVPDETFGFGVAFTRRTLDLLGSADKQIVAELQKASVAVPPQEIRNGQDSIFNAGNAGSIAIARSVLLNILTEQAQRAGVDVQLGREVTLKDLDDADMVIAADGVSSSVRSGLATEFGEVVNHGRGLFMWLGCDAQLTSNLFAPVRTRHGLFNIHCYPYANNRSTIGVETDVGTWQRAGLDICSRNTPEGASDIGSIAYLQQVFGEVLGGASLLGNRSRWMHFRTVRADRWSHRRVVLLGDAAHTAHYSVGSGTKMAMEDAAELVATLRANSASPLTRLLDEYEASRRPRAERLQELATRSRLWWESLETRLHLPLPVLMVAYLSRGGAVGVTKIAQSDPDLLDQALGAAGFNGTAAQSDRLLSDITATPWPLSAPRVYSRAVLPSSGLRSHHCEVDIQDPWGPDATEELARLVQSVPANADAVILAGPAGRSSVLDRLALAERLRSMTAVGVGVSARAEFVGDLVDGLVAGRIDLYRLID